MGRERLNILYKHLGIGFLCEQASSRKPRTPSLEFHLMRFNGCSQSYLRKNVVSLVLSFTCTWHMSFVPQWSYWYVCVTWLLAFSKLGHILYFCCTKLFLFLVKESIWMLNVFVGVSCLPICEKHILYVVMSEQSVMPWQDMLDVACLWA